MKNLRPKQLLITGIYSAVKTFVWCLAIIITSNPTLRAQQPDSVYLQKQWKANWIMVPGASTTGYGVYMFRKSINLKTMPKKFEVLVSADNRYKLFINGKMISTGPARGDLLHWNFETLDLAPYLQTGLNIIAAQVWNDGEFKPNANFAIQTGFILQGNNEFSRGLNTDKTWKCTQDSSYSPLPVHLPTYYVAGPGEQVTMRYHPKDWASLNFDDHLWPNALPFGEGMPKNKPGFTFAQNLRLLTPSIIPQMSFKEERLVSLRKAKGIVAPAGFPLTRGALTIAANSKDTLLFDQTYLTNAYPTLIFSGGNSAEISISYAESLYTKYPGKGNRNEIDGKYFLGRKDSIVLDGTQRQEFTPLAWRTYRYIQVVVHTKAEPVILEDIFGTATGYPFTLNAQIKTDNTELQNILNIGWRTARLCAMETYMDCPYYEQLQYIGDTRIQALVSLYNSGDDRLVLNALSGLDNSREPEGLFQACYPTNTTNYIPPFSLWYIGMLHDYMMYGKNTAFIQKKLLSARQILQYFGNYQQADGALKNLPWWNFTDWVNGWDMGVSPPGKDGNSAILDLQLLWAYELAADMELKIGMKDYGRLDLQKAAQLKITIRKKYWDVGKQLFADRVEKDNFSQHTNALAILTGMVSGADAKSIGKKLLTDPELTQASIYFKFYLHQALVKADLGDNYLNWLDKWRENIQLGLSTWAEISDINNTRSDCHAWGASPNIEIFRTILGIDSESPAFRQIKIEPHLDNIKSISGQMPHPFGKISVSYQILNARMEANINLPPNTTGHFLWKGKRYLLSPGFNKLKI